MATATSAAHAAESEPEDLEATSHVTLTDVETGEVLYSESETVQLSDTGTTTIESDIEPDGDLLQPLASKSGTVNPGSIQSSLTLTYTKKTEDIRLENVKGSWTPDSPIEVRNRRVLMINGGVSPERLEKFPTSNSYNYSTGFGFSQWTESGNYIPRALAEVDHRIAGTNGNLVRLTHWVELLDV